VSYRVVEDYYRQEHFDFFRAYEMPFYTITFDLDITEVTAFAKEREFPVYLTTCFLFTRGMSRIEDFRYRVIEDRIVLYDNLEIAATLPAPSGAFSFAHFEHEPDLETFLCRAESVSRRAREQATLEDTAEGNTVLFTSLPGVRFTGFTHATPSDRTDGRARVAFGRFFEDEGRLMTPVGLGVNHIFIDGAAIGRLVEAVQAEFDHPGL
jgi:chloramphenicol O-acetyltransferase type A